MPDKSFADALNEQISNEFAAHQQYVAAAVYYDAETLPRLAGFFYRQAAEERTHAMMMVQYLLDVGEEVRIPDIRAQQTTYIDGSEPVKMALEQEKRVSFASMSGIRTSWLASSRYWTIIIAWFRSSTAWR